jgi:hypothetical protein
MAQNRLKYTKNYLILHNFTNANYVILRLFRNFPQNYQINGFRSSTEDKKKSKKIQILKLAPLMVVVVDGLGEVVVDGIGKVVVDGLCEVVVVIAC